MPTDRQALAALDDIDRILNERMGRPLAADGRSVSTEALSSDYWEIRMRLDTALTLVNKIPVYGRRIATAVRFLMQICDRHCAPSPAPERDNAQTVEGHPSIGKTVVVHELPRPRSLRKDASDLIQSGAAGAGDRGLMGIA